MAGCNPEKPSIGRVWTFLEPNRTMYLSLSHYGLFSVWGRLVGDNIDHEILVRVQTKTHTNPSIHWTHQFAVLDRVQEPGLNDSNS